MQSGNLNTLLQTEGDKQWLHPLECECMAYGIILFYSTESALTPPKSHYLHRIVYDLEMETVLPYRLQTDQCFYGVFWSYAKKNHCSSQLGKIVLRNSSGLLFENKLVLDELHN